ncbi:MAG: hypothetical protein DIU60_022675 [Actinomycetes bacterium]|jgi:uncharacterized protein Yka (UPF0111/DUF47 family)|nr:MAG: hypothetical protein DIU60_13915 [Actinomycetota bacterium]
MRRRSVRLLLAAAVLLAPAAAGCSTLDKAQACLESSRVVTETINRIREVGNDPAELERALNDAVERLEEIADKVGNTTLNEALTDLARTLEGITVRDVDDAIDAVQRVVTDGAAAAERIARECT